MNLRWTPEEDAIVRRFARTGRGWARCASEHLPRRTRNRIVARARMLGAGADRAEWTGRENEILTAAWGTFSRRAILAMLPHRAWPAIHDHATTGLRLGSAAGARVPLSACARRVGYSRAQLRKILERHGVAMQRHPGDGRGRARSRVWLLDFGAVMDAVRAEHARVNRMETLREASARVCMSENRLRMVLKAEGVLLGDRRGSRWLIDPSAVDRAMAAWRTRPGVRRARGERIGRAV